MRLQKFQYWRAALLAIALSVCLGFAPTTHAQQSFSNNSQDVDIGATDPIVTSGKSDLRQAVEDLVGSIIMLMGIAAVFVIVIAGIGLVVGFGSEESRSRVIKVLLYTAAGFIVIALASAVVRFISDAILGG